MRSFCISFIIAATFWPAVVSGQGYIGYDYAPMSTMRNKLGDRFGQGSMQKVEGRGNITLSAKQDSAGRATVWSLGLSAAYATLENQGMATSLNPNDIFNGGLSVTHIRPFSRRWDIMASLVYQDADKTNLFAKKLSQVYRYLLSTHGRPTVTLDEELRFLDPYLYLEKIRFDDTLHVSIPRQTACATVLLFRQAYRCSWRTP